MAVSPTPAAIRAQLRRVLENPLFSNAHRMSQFLQFVVVRSIEGQAGEIKEYLIGVEVYQRNPSYDPKADSIVRAEASRLRAKLREYYDTVGRDDPVRIELPKGAYTPVFRLHSSTAVPEPDRPPEPPPPAKLQRKWVAAAALLVALATAIVWLPGRGGKKIRSIAVMAPANLNSDRTDDRLGDTWPTESPPL